MKPTAYKLRISDLLRGRYVRSADISEPSHLITPFGNKVIKARVIGTVVEKFLRDDHGYAMLRLDDGTDTITVRAWREEVQELEKFDLGDVLDVIGRIREFEGKVYIVPDMIIKVEDPNFELMREIENLNHAWLSRFSGSGAEAVSQAGEQVPEEGLPQVSEELKNRVILALERLDAPEGVSPMDICNELGIPEAQVEEALRVLLILGSIYEPLAGKYRLTR